MTTNRQWILARRPTGALSLDDFAFREVQVPDATQDLAPGQILVRNRLFRFAPAMRTWMKANSAFVAPIPADEPMAGAAAGEVIASRNPAYPVGSIYSFMSSWQDYATFDPDKLPVPPRRKPDAVSLEDLEGLLGGNSLTAYFGLLKVGEARAGQTLVVSGAAGSTGSIAAQIGRIVGCRVVGIAGGAVKCAWLVNACGLDGAIDYRAENVEGRLAELCPEGIDIFFDNVGGATLDAAIANMAPHGRVVLCGQISSYDDGDRLAAGPRDMMRVVYWRIRLQGFLAIDFTNSISQAEADLSQWARQGALIHRAEIVDGFARLPETFLRLFDGDHIGTMLLRND